MITLVLTGLFRGVRTQRALVLENLALRHQLTVLRRSTPRQALLDLEESAARARPPSGRPGAPSTHPPDGRGQPPLGRTPHSRGAPEGRPRDLPGDGLEVPGPPSNAPVTDLADLPRQPRRDAGLCGLLRRAHGALQGLARLRRPGARPATRRPRQRDGQPDSPMDSPATRRGVPVGHRAPIPAARPRCGVRAVFSSRVRSLGIHEVTIAPRSPWQNPYVERLIGTLRRECLNHTVVLNDAHLRRLRVTTSSTTTVPGPTSLWRRTPRSPDRWSVPTGVAWSRRLSSAASISTTPARPRKLRPAVCPGHADVGGPGVYLPARASSRLPPAGSIRQVGCRARSIRPLLVTEAPPAPPPTVRGPSMSTRMVKQNRQAIKRPWLPYPTGTLGGCYSSGERLIPSPSRH